MLLLQTYVCILFEQFFAARISFSLETTTYRSGKGCQSSLWSNLHNLYSLYHLWNADCSEFLIWVYNLHAVCVYIVIVCVDRWHTWCCHRCLSGEWVLIFTCTSNDIMSYTCVFSFSHYCSFAYFCHRIC